MSKEIGKLKKRGNTLKIVLILIGFLFLIYIGTKIFPLKLKYANVSLTLITHVLASFSYPTSFFDFDDLIVSSF